MKISVVPILCVILGSNTAFGHSVDREERQRQSECSLEVREILDLGKMQLDIGGGQLSQHHQNTLSLAMRELYGDLFFTTRGNYCDSVWIRELESRVEQIIRTMKDLNAYNSMNVTK